MEIPGRDLADEVEKFYHGGTCDVTGQVNTKCLTFPFNAFAPQNAENKRINSLWIDMIRVCGISEHRPYPEVPFSEVKVIWDHELKLRISVIWRRNTCLWVVFSSRTRKMTLEHRLLHRNRNKMNVWNCMVLRPNALKSSHFSHSKCYKNNVSEGSYFKLATYIHSLKNILAHIFRLLKI